MNRLCLWAVALGTAVAGVPALADDTKAPADKVFDGTAGVRIVVRAQGPYDAEAPVQVVCGRPSRLVRWST
jgi:hypothetical protein